MTEEMRDRLARVRKLANRAGVSDEELGQYLADRAAYAESEEETTAGTKSEPRRLSLYEKSILLAVLIGMGYVIEQSLRYGLRHAMGTVGYVAFCLFMISSKRLFKDRVGTYIIGTGIRLPPDYRPMWGAGIALGWVFLSLPAVLMVLRTMILKE
jgi:hypothetical protein